MAMNEKERSNNAGPGPTGGWRLFWLQKIARDENGLAMVAGRDFLIVD